MAESSNARDPLEIFPKEIWEMIIGHLKKQGSITDVWNCSKACTEFESILEPTKQEWLFGSIYPFIVPYLKGGELLACRQVCKNWRHGVDKFLEDFETRMPFNDETSDISRFPQHDPLEQKGIKWTKIRGDSALVKFLEAMKGKEMKTPFMGGSLSLEYCNFGWDLEELLSLFGGQIWHFRVVPKESNTFHSDQFYQILKETLGSTPNLKSLTFHNRAFFAAYKDDNSRPLEENPLLEIKSLESLVINTYCTPPAIILEKVSKTINLGNLKCLKLHHYYSYYIRPHIVVKPLQHLTELHVSEIQWGVLEHILTNVISPTAPLAKLSLSFPVLLKNNDFDRACEIISRWKETLRVLDIKVNRYSSSNPGISLSNVDAPNVKSLDVEGILFEEVLPATLTPSLEYLTVRYNDRDYPVDDRNRRRMEFHRCVFQKRELHNSSIWGDMKKLKLVRVQRLKFPVGTEMISCTRDMHERGIQASSSSN